MKNQRAIRGLIGLNAALALCLALVTFSSPVTAQQAVNRNPGNYTMVGGNIQGQTIDAIYIVDSSNQEMVAMMWDQSRREMQAIGYRDLALDGQVSGRVGR